MNTQHSKPLVCLFAHGKNPADFNYHHLMKHDGDGEPKIAKIIQSFSDLAEFIITLQTEARTLTTYIVNNFPLHNIKFVKLNQKNQKENLLSEMAIQLSEKYINRPFYIIDTNIDHLELPDKNHSELLTTKINGLTLKNLENEKLTPDSISFKIRQNRVYECNPQTVNAHIDQIKLFAGCAFIYHWKEFFAGPRKIFQHANEFFYLSGLEYLIQYSLVSCLDSSQFEKIGSKRPVQKDLILNEFNMTRYYANANLALESLVKAQIKPKVYPRNIRQDEKLLTYDSINGDDIDLEKRPLMIDKLLNWSLKELWPLPMKYPAKEFMRHLKEIYFDETKKTITELSKRYAFFNQNTPSKINGIKINSIKKVFSLLPWDHILNSSPKYIHGNFIPTHFKYIKNEQSFKTFYWNGVVANELEIGDMYFDLATMYNFLSTDLEYFKKCNRNFDHQKNQRIDFIKPIARYPKALKHFEAFLINRSFDIHKIKIIANLLLLQQSTQLDTPQDISLALWSWYTLDNLVGDHQNNADINYQV